MSNSELLSLDVTALYPLLRERRLSPVELTQTYLERIAALEPKLHCYITVTAESALQAARAAEREIAGGAWRGPFHGIPVALKDLCYTQGVRTTGGSKILAEFVPDYDCTLWARLKAAGAVLLGKLNLHEFASGPTSNNPHWGTCHNPYDLERIPGGSSGGSAAAIVAAMAAATIGSDTGGSIRLPAAFCGCVGLKQTYSRVSRYGVIPLSDSLDHAGPITKSVRDAALMLQVIAGHDPNDATSSHEALPDFAAACEGGVSGMRIGVIRELTSGLESGYEPVFQAALAKLRELGAQVEELSVPAIEHAWNMVSAIIWAEMFEYHEAWMRTRPRDYGHDVRRLLEAAMLLPAASYVRAQKARAVILAQMLAALERVTVLVAPTTSVEAPRLDSGSRAFGAGKEAMDTVKSMLRFTAPANITGQPALAIPIGLGREGLPLSMQFMGRPFDEAAVFRAAAAYEAARGPLAAPKL